MRSRRPGSTTAEPGPVFPSGGHTEVKSHELPPREERPTPGPGPFSALRKGLPVGILLVHVLAIGFAGYAYSRRETAKEIRAGERQLEFIAEAKGYFAANGVTVVQQRFTSGRDALGALAAHEADAATVFENRGEEAFPEFRVKDSRWFRDDTYFFVWTLDGIRLFHAANPQSEGEDVSSMKDVLGRPMGRMFLETAATANGEGWVHYMNPEPGDIFPTWKSTFLKRVKFPSGKEYLIGCGIYNMEMDRAFIEDVVRRAGTLVAERGKEGFPQLRDKTGAFFFMDTYVFVDLPDGTELVNAAQPSLEGKNLRDVKDVKGKLLVRDYINAATKQGSGWVDYYWYRPGNNTPAHKYSYVRKVQHGAETYIVGAGFYSSEEN